MTHKLYRSRNGKFLGVCQGIADWKDFPVQYVRWGFVLAAIFLNVPALLIYLILAFFLEPAPRDGFTSEKDDFRYDREDGSSRFKSRFNSMKEDLNNKEKDWEDRFKDS